MVAKIDTMARFSSFEHFFFGVENMNLLDGWVYHNITLFEFCLFECPIRFAVVDQFHELRLVQVRHDVPGRSLPIKTPLVYSNKVSVLSKCKGRVLSL